MWAAPWIDPTGTPRVWCTPSTSRNSIFFLSVKKLHQNASWVRMTLLQVIYNADSTLMEKRKPVTNFSTLPIISIKFTCHTLQLMGSWHCGCKLQRCEHSCASLALCLHTELGRCCFTCAFLPWLVASLNCFLSKLVCHISTFSHYLCSWFRLWLLIIFLF